MRGKVSLVLIVVLALGVLGAGIASGITTAAKFTLIGPSDEFRELDLGPNGPSLGDQIIFSGPLRKPGGHLAGRYDGFCVFTSKGSGRSEHRQQCFVTSTIGTANGETEIQAGGVGRIQAEDVLLSVTGGTGRYQNVRGQVEIVLQQNRTLLHYSLIP